MASGKEYLNMVLDSLSEIGDISSRPMMGEYIIYYKGKVVGGIYDNRFLIKPTKPLLEIISQPVFELPYEGAKEMILIESLDDRAFLKKIFDAI